MLANCPTELIHGDCFLALQSISPHFTVNLKLEGFSITGSIKIKAALHMLTRLQDAGRMPAGARLIESSSGNLGLALSMVCAARGIAFTCVSDPNIPPPTARLIRAYGAEIIIVRDRDANGGFLGTRIDLIKSMLLHDPQLVWVNQYENVENIGAHQRTTAVELLQRFPAPDYVFIGAGTTGTLGGVSRLLRECSPHTKIIAVDSVGSVTFGGVSGRRYIPGLGTSAAPAIRRHASFDEMLMVPEADTVRLCRRLARGGLLLGGSSGTVLAGVQRFATQVRADACVVAISPDLGDRYADTIYNDDWVRAHFPQLSLGLCEGPAHHGEASALAT